MRRCEACRLGVVGEPGDEADALAALEELRIGDDGGTPRYRIANRSSLAASLGGKGWVPIDAGTRYLFTPEAVRRLVAGRGQELAGGRWRPVASIVLTWGTLLNSFTWGRNVALGALGRAVATPARQPWQRAQDAFISVVATPVVLLAAVLVETVAALAGRGGVLELTLRLE